MPRLPVRNQYNEIIGYVEEESSGQVLRNKHGEIVGRTINGHTYDKNWNMVSREENIGILYGELNAS